MSIIITHHNPDLDAVASIWIVKRFWPGWKKAQLTFVPAGETYANQPADVKGDILHVDTGLGEYDHHQTNEFTCSALLCWQKTKDQQLKINAKDAEAVERLLEVVCEVDHGRNANWPEAISDRYVFFLEDILGGLNGIRQQDEEVVNFGLIALDAVLKVIGDKIKAEEVLTDTEAIKFKTQWGQGIALQTSNEAVLKLGGKMGYSLVLKKDKKRGDVRIYCRWDRGVDLTKAYQQLKKMDPQATWFLHASRCLLLNGSPSNPKMKPTKLSLSKIISIFT